MDLCESNQVLNSLVEYIKNFLSQYDNSDICQLLSLRVHCYSYRTRIFTFSYVTLGSGNTSSSTTELVRVKRGKLQDGWEEIFLEPCALHEDIERVRALAEIPPPRQAASGN